MQEKERIEKDTAEKFIYQYNKSQEETFEVVDVSDAPDIKCRNANGVELRLEITLTEDRNRDIAAALGRSDHRSLERLKEELALAKQGKANILGSFDCLEGNVLETLLERIHKKLTKAYGNNVALVVRDTSGCDWDWERVLPVIAEDISRYLKEKGLPRSPYDRGIWLLSLDGQKLRLLFE